MKKRPELAFRECTLKMFRGRDSPMKAAMQHSSKRRGTPVFRDSYRGQTFIDASYPTIFRYLKMKDDSMRCVHEQITAGYPVKPFMDLEFLYKYNSTVDDDEVLKAIVLACKQRLSEKFEIPLERINHIIWNASKTDYSTLEGKFSVHVIFNIKDEKGNHVAFKDIEHARMFFQECLVIWSKEEEKSPGSRPSFFINTELRTGIPIVDIAVYRPNGFFRTPYSGKCEDGMAVRHLVRPKDFEDCRINNFSYEQFCRSLLLYFDPSKDISRLLNCGVTPSEKVAKFRRQNIRSVRRLTTRSLPGTRKRFLAILQANSDKMTGRTSRKFLDVSRRLVHTVCGHLFCEFGVGSIHVMSNRIISVWSTSTYCPIKGDHHNSSKPYICIDLKTGQYKFKCKSPNGCEGTETESHSFCPAHAKLCKSIYDSRNVVSVNLGYSYKI